jgi:hypothetical protein
MAAGHALGPELLAAFAYGWPTHLLLAEHALAQRSTRNDSHRLKVPIAVRTLSEYGELDGCASLSPVSAPLAGELDERGHGSSLPRRARIKEVGWLATGALSVASGASGSSVERKATARGADWGTFAARRSSFADGEGRPGPRSLSAH